MLREKEKYDSISDESLLYVEESLQWVGGVFNSLLSSHLI